MEKQYTIEGMSCHHCIMGVENELRNAGFEKFEVKLGSAKIEFDNAEENEKKIVAAIEEAGYKVVAA
ncbi:MAG: heavy-metal-associated domain-containing protein [Chlorobi bacterium]|nr:heavy-metal-associated domain-containing protein [Chlorobiota bacterium]